MFWSHIALPCKLPPDYTQWLVLPDFSKALLSRHKLWCTRFTGMQMGKSLWHNDNHWQQFQTWWWSLLSLCINGIRIPVLPRLRALSLMVLLGGEEISWFWKSKSWQNKVFLFVFLFNWIIDQGIWREEVLLFHIKVWSWFMDEQGMSSSHKFCPSLEVHLQL